MTDDPERPGNPDSGDLASPFLFVPHGAPEPTEWMRKHPGWVKFPAVFVPRAPAAVRTIPGTNRPWPLDKRGQPWPRSRFGQPLRPLDEYPPGVRAPGEGYTGPIADPDAAMRAALASQDVLAQAAKSAADPDAPIRAYLSAMEVWKNPGKYAGYPWPGAARTPSQAERNADAIRAGMDRAQVVGTGGGTREAANASHTMTDATGLPGLENLAPDGTPVPGTPGATLLARPVVPISPSGNPVVDGLRTALAPAQGTTYGDVLPFAKDDATGDVRVAMPNAVRDLANGVVDLLDGPRTGTVTPEATNALAGLMMGGLSRGAAAGGAEALSGRLLSTPGKTVKDAKSAGITAAQRRDQLATEAGKTSSKGFSEADTILQAEREGKLAGVPRRPDPKAGEPDHDYVVSDSDGKTLGYTEIKTPTDPKRRPIEVQANDIAGKIKLYPPAENLQIIVDLKNLSTADKVLFLEKLEAAGIGRNDITLLNEK